MPESPKKKVLIVSFIFPPANDVAALRTGKFARYLPEFGWEPVVLTADRIRLLPQTMPVEISEASIYRTPYFAPANLVIRRLRYHNDHNATAPSSPMNKTKSKREGVRVNALALLKPIYSLPVLSDLLHNPLYWYRSGVKRGMELIKKGDIDVIFSSYGPSVSHLVASRLQKETGIPWVAEFKDLWSLNHYTRKREPLHSLEKQKEKRTMKNSALLITVSEPLAQELAGLHSKKVVTIPNGFDEADYSGDVPLLPKFTITYTGSIYPGRQDPSPFFQAIAELRDEGTLLPDSLEVRFFGGNILANVINPLVERYKVDHFVRLYGLVPFKDSTVRQKESTALLLLSWNDPREKGVYTAKVFEYLGASRPVLAIGLKGSVIDDLLARTGGGIIASEVDEIKSILVRWLGEFSQYGEITSYYNPDREAIKQYSRREETAKLAEALDRVVNRTP